MSFKRKIQTTLSFAPKPKHPPQSSEPPKYLFIDTSYTVFHKFYATKIWYKLAHPEEEVGTITDWHENHEFMDKFKKNYLLAIDKLARGHYIRNKKIIFACDCSRRSIWRRDYFESYKQNRDGKYGKGEGQLNISPFFVCVYKELIPLINKKYGCMMLKHDCLEADDILFLTKSFIINNLHPEANIIVITSDLDLLQLCDDYTQLRDFKNRDITVKSLGSASLDLGVKILCGDKSDNIPGCFRRCGKKTAIRLVQHPHLLESRFIKEPESREIYDRNRILIDLNCIPEELQKSFSQYLNKELSLFL